MTYKALINYFILRF